MRATIAAALVWYDEPLVSLERCIRSLAEHEAADHLVVVDGRWDAYDDDAPAWSPREQRMLVHDLTRELFLSRGHVFEPIHERQSWGSQIEKRAWTYQRCAELADWVLVIDADEHVEYCEPKALRDTLAATDRLTGFIGQRTLYGPSAPAGVWPSPRLFIGKHGITVEHSHNGIRTMNGTFLAGDPKFVDIAPAVDCGLLIRTFHSQGGERSHDREMLDRQYRRRRRELRIEGWPPRRSGPA